MKKYLRLIALVAVVVLLVLIFVILPAFLNSRSVTAAKAEMSAAADRVRRDALLALGDPEATRKAEEQAQEMFFLKGDTHISDLIPMLAGDCTQRKAAVNALVTSCRPDLVCQAMQKLALDDKTDSDVREQAKEVLHQLNPGEIRKLVQRSEQHASFALAASTQASVDAGVALKLSKDAFEATAELKLELSRIEADLNQFNGDLLACKKAEEAARNKLAEQVANTTKAVEVYAQACRSQSSSVKEAFDAAVQAKAEAVRAANLYQEESAKTANQEKRLQTLEAKKKQAMVGFVNVAR